LGKGTSGVHAADSNDRPLGFLEYSAKYQHDPAMRRSRIDLLKRQQYFPNRKTRVVVNRQVRHAPMDQHRHEFFEIAFVLSGSGIHVTDHFSHRIEARDVLVLNSHRPHGYERPVGLNLINILIRTDLMRRLGRELGGLSGYHSLFTLEPARWRRRDYISHLRLSSAEMVQIEEWTNRLEEETFQKGRDGNVLAEAYLTLIVGMLCRRYGKKTGLSIHPESKFGHMLSWIEQKLDHPLAVADLAHEMGMSERTLHRRFRLTVGTTPIAYLVQARVRRAAEELTRENGENLRIGDVANACGFEDSNYFSRCFRKVMGRSPRDYQRTCRRDYNSDNVGK
jgi:AraC-like DNA-binding protein